MTKALKNRRFYVIVPGLLLCTMLSACGALRGDLEYVVRAANYTNQGVILIDFPVVRGNDEVEATRGIYPGVPGVHDHVAYLGQFAEFRHTLPDNMSVTWQAAELTDCKHVLTFQSHVQNDSDSREYARKLSCDWTPREGQVFTRELDMDAIRNSEAYRVAANPPPGSFLRGQPTLRIDLIFRDSGLEVRTSRGRSLGFMQ